KFKLSDYRGKVVLLNFWASWCGPCMAMVPNEKKIAERYKDKPFALVGVDADGTIADAKKAVEKEQISWPSFWAKGVWDSPTLKAWNITGLPTYFVIDQKGVVRLKMEGMGKETRNILNTQISRLLTPDEAKK